MRTLYLTILIILLIIHHNVELKAQWIQANTGLSNASITGIVNSGTNIYASTSGQGVYLSTNNGTSWSTINDGITNLDVRVLTVSGVNLFAGSYLSNIFLSTNNGISWKKIDNRGALSFAVKGTTIFAGTPGDCVILSTNNGESWKQAGLGGCFISSLAFSDKYLFAGTLGSGIFISSDEGISWNQINNGLTNKTVYSLAVSGTNVFAGTDQGVFLSTNNGTNWIRTTTYYGVLALAVVDKKIFCGTQYGGVYLTTNNGTNWTQVNTGLTTSYIYSFGVVGTDLFAGTYNSGVYRRSLNDWMSIITPENSIGGLIPPISFKWKVNPKGLAYTYQISTKADFSDLLIN
ncbi:MAG: hypothetical protein V1799_19995 [bacterium]